MLCAIVVTHTTPQEALERISAHETFLETLLQKEVANEECAIWNAILQAMDTLNDDEREVITLKYLADMSYNDIAALMNKKPNTLAMLLKHALEKNSSKNRSIQ